MAQECTHLEICILLVILLPTLLQPLNNHVEKLLPIYCAYSLLWHMRLEH